MSTAGTTVTNLAAITGANTCLSAYGRLWLADFTNDKMTVRWSNLLDGTNFDTGSAGSIDIAAVLVNGTDEIVALGAHNGRLIIFCKDNIVIYGDTDADQILDPVNMRLVEVITGVGCVARDSVQNTGTDIVFLSRTGLMSLGRVLQEKSQPMRDLSKNIRDDLVQYVVGNTAGEIRSVYHPEEAFYLLYIPEYTITYCFDMRSALQDGSSRVTLWQDQNHTNFLASQNTLYFTETDGLAKYSSYRDNGSDYRMKYYTSYFDFDDATRTKIVKRVAATVVGGGSQTIVFKLADGYTGVYDSFSVSLVGDTVYEYGIGEYNIAEFVSGIVSENLRVPMGGNGNVLQVGFETSIDGAELSVQRLDLYIKQGRIY